MVAVVANSPAEKAGVLPGDEFISLNGRRPRDVIEYRLIVDEARIEIEIARGGIEHFVTIDKQAGEPLGAEVSSALFDRVRTCDNHCEFCFIHQLPRGLRKSLYLKDDDYRLSFLYGNFTTLTRFTEADLERVITERLSPLFVSIHATDPELRARLLRNRRGATSLRWLKQLLAAGIEVHGQIVVCPGLNDGPHLARTLVDILEEYPSLATVAAVPLGVSRFSKESGMRPHEPAEAAAVIDTVEAFQEIYLKALGKRMAYVADEYYLLAGRPFPPASHYDGFPQHENGIGLASAFRAAFDGDEGAAFGVQPGFFSWVDGAPAEGYRSWRSSSQEQTALVTLRRNGAPKKPGSRSPVGVITGEYGAKVLRPLLSDSPLGRDVHLVEVANNFFGGNIAVTGLLSGADVAEALRQEPEAGHYLLPDVCLSQGKFIDGMTLEDLPRTVQVLPSDGGSLRRALERL